MRRLLNWCWWQFWKSVFIPAAHQLYPDQVPPWRFRDDLLVVVLFPFLYLPALIYQISKNHPLNFTENHDDAGVDSETSKKECF